MYAYKLEHVAINNYLCQLLVKKKQPKNMLTDVKLRETTTTSIANKTNN